MATKKLQIELQDTKRKQDFLSRILNLFGKGRSRETKRDTV